MKKKMKLGFFLKLHGHHIASWRHEDAPTNILSLENLQSLAKTAEKGKFDMVFLADHLDGNVHLDSAFNRTSNLYLEPFTTLSALAAVTTNIGLTGTVSTTFNSPFHVARKFNSLDHLSNGRAAWNIVTSSTDNEAKNFNMETIPNAEKRYERAFEFVELTKKLWKSWEPGALKLDKINGLYAERSEVHEVFHEGQYFNVKGPLNLPSSPQKYPVLIQAGSSETGRNFAAKSAEVIFTAWSNIEDAKDFYKDMKFRVEKYGRSPNSIKIMPGLCPIVGRTKEEAMQKEQRLLDLIHPQAGISLIYNLSGVDLSNYPVNGPVPDLPDLERSKGIQSRYQLVKKLAEENNYTIKQLYESLSFGRGHYRITGTPIEIADMMETWITEEAADGFNVLPPLLPDDLEDFVELVIPELQKRGIFKTDYSGNTLRENLGIAEVQLIN